MEVSGRRRGRCHATAGNRVHVCGAKWLLYTPLVRSFKIYEFLQSTAMISLLRIDC
jgi:hypothetical protein